MTERLVDQVDDHFGRKHGVYGSALSDMALMMKSTGKHQEATEVYLKALEVCRRVHVDMHVCNILLPSVARTLVCTHDFHHKISMTLHDRLCFSRQKFFRVSREKQEIYFSAGGMFNLRLVSVRVKRLARKCVRTTAAQRTSNVFADMVFCAQHLAVRWI